MRKRWLVLPVVPALLFLPSCKNSGGALAGHPAGTGPFDARGNYVEAWADNPSQWRKASQSPVSEPARDMPALAQNTPPPVVVPTPVTRPVTSTTTVIHTRPQPVRPAPTVAANKPKPTSAAPPKPKPKPVLVKPKPSSSRYAVRKGDTLYAIAKRHGTSVGAIQKANRLNGTVIHPGQSLTIPR